MQLRRLVAGAMLFIASTALARRKEDTNPHGQVTLADGSVPHLLVSIERVCKGTVETTVFADSEGRFTIPAGDSTGCQLRAYLPGYGSENIAEKPDAGTLVLKPRGKTDFASRAEKDKPLVKMKNAWKAYLRGLDESARGKWRAAENSFHDVTTAASWSAAAWLCLGIVQERDGDFIAAKKSYREAIKAEDTFALPYVYAAAIELSRGDWQEAFDNSNKAIQLDAQSFAGAWLANAWSNLNLHQMDAAETSAHEGIKLDGEHRFPDLEYVLGLVLLDRRDAAGAKEHFKNYLALDPHGPRADSARAEIEKQ